jgi:hypothetical protein
MAPKAKYISDFRSPTYLALRLCAVFGMVAAECDQLLANGTICASGLPSFALFCVLDHLLHLMASAATAVCIPTGAGMNQRVDALLH